MTVGGPTITLSNGVKMPQVGLGTWQSTPEEVKAAVRAAVEAGYRLIDTATCYQNEDAIGEAIKELIAEGKVKREELFITTKLWATHLHPDDTEGALRESLEKLQLEYVDLYLAHMPACFNHDMSAQNHSVTVQDVWRGLEGVYKKGLAKAIGVSNWSGEQIERVLKTAEVPIHNCQVELYLYWPQHELQEVCKKHNISLTSYASLGSPGRVNFSLPGGVKLDWAPAPNALEDPHVKELATKYSKTPAQILLRYVMDRGIAIIPKSVNASRIVENFKLFDFSLTPEDIKLLETTKHRQRLFLQDFMEGHPEDPFRAKMTVGGPTITLSNGVKMPQVGLGTWQSKPEEVKAAVRAAVEAGYRLIDTAATYQNEDAIGVVVKELIAEGKVKREELFITTKLWASHLHPDDTEGALRESLKKLQLEYVDLYLAHMPACFTHDMSAQNHSVTVRDVWRGLEGVYKKGLAKAIGVSNWSGEQIERVLKTAEVPIHNCQVELHLYWPQHELHEVCKKHNISLTSYASLGSPGRVNFSLAGAKVDWAPAPNLLEDPHVKELATKYSKTPAQILLRFVMDRGIAIIPKSVNASRIVENFSLFDFSLTPEDIKLLETTKHRQRLFTQDFMKGHPEDPVLDQFLLLLVSHVTTMTVGGPTITLSNGVQMPQVGLGTWQSKPSEVKNAVKVAVETGYRLIDTATVYENEGAIGLALKELIDSGKITRGEIFITTKLWSFEMHSPETVENAVRRSLKLLQTDYVDLYLAHMPACFYKDMKPNTSVKVEDIWRGLEAVYKKGLAKAIGVSNWTADQIERVMKIADVPIHNCQVELHIYWPQHELHEVCKKHNISVTSYASLGSPGRVNFQHGRIKWAPAPSALADLRVVKLAEKYKKTPAQILLRHLMQRNIAVIPKSVNESRIAENFQVFDFELSPEDFQEMESVVFRQRLFMQEFMKGHPEDPFAAER
ncbi:hypothetical protein Q1695_010006 [Nippostrongylus brasiliensis]|nr:hypothetical protein Q1695_010006 [Nippostrongylus brasiliensis]